MNIYKQFVFAKEGQTIIQQIFSNSGTAAAPRMIRSSIACPKWRTHHGSMGTKWGQWRSKIDALIISESTLINHLIFRVPNFETTFEVLYPSWNGWWLSPNLRHPFLCEVKHSETRWNTSGKKTYVRLLTIGPGPSIYKLLYLVNYVTYSTFYLKCFFRSMGQQHGIPWDGGYWFLAVELLSGSTISRCVKHRFHFRQGGWKINILYTLNHQAYHHNVMGRGSFLTTRNLQHGHQFHFVMCKPSSSNLNMVIMCHNHGWPSNASQKKWSLSRKTKSTQHRCKA